MCAFYPKCIINFFLTSGERAATERAAVQPFRQPGGHLGRQEAGAGGADHQTTGRETETCSSSHASARRPPGGRGDAGGVGHPVHRRAAHVFVYRGGSRFTSEG